jgi:anti-sigma B factor antagonist
MRRSPLKPVPFEVQSETLDGVRVIAVSGELDLNTAPQLEEPLAAALESEGPALVIDLAECEFIDSTGIALIVRAWQRLNNVAGQDGSRFALCCVNDQVRRLLDITGLESSIPTHTSRDEALAELRG